MISTMKMRVTKRSLVPTQDDHSLRLFAILFYLRYLFFPLHSHVLVLWFFYGDLAELAYMAKTVCFLMKFDC